MLHFDLHYLCMVEMKSSVRKIELLAPARDANVAIEAIKHGADAVYMGASKFGARSAAGNEIADIARVVEFAHQFEAKVYVTAIPFYMTMSWPACRNLFGSYMT